MGNYCVRIYGKINFLDTIMTWVFFLITIKPMLFQKCAVIPVLIFVIQHQWSYVNMIGPKCVVYHIHNCASEQAHYNLLSHVILLCPLREHGTTTAKMTSTRSSSCRTRMIRLMPITSSSTRNETSSCSTASSLPNEDRNCEFFLVGDHSTDIL